jgi:serine/threonine-protein kinase RsbW
MTGIWKAVSLKLEANQYTTEQIFAVHLALEEAFINAVKHGNNQDLAKKVKIDYCINRDKAEIFVKDEGGGFNPAGVPDPRCGENIYKPNGRGLLLIKSYMDTVEYNEKGDCVHLVKYKEVASRGKEGEK